MFAVRCLLCVVCWSLMVRGSFLVCCLLFVVCCLLVVVCCLWFVGICLLFVVYCRCMSLCVVVCWLLFVCLFVVSRLLYDGLCHMIT